MLPGDRLVTSRRSSAATDSTTRLLVCAATGSARNSWLAPPSALEKPCSETALSWFFCSRHADSPTVCAN